MSNTMTRFLFTQHRLPVIPVGSFVLFFMTVGTVAAAAHSAFVAPNENDQNPGTSGLPVRPWLPVDLRAMMLC